MPNRRVQAVKKQKTDTRLDRSVGVGGVGNVRAEQTCERSEKAKPSGSDAEKDIEANEFVARFVELKLQVVWCQYLYVCTSKASTLNLFVARCVKLDCRWSSSSSSCVSICTFVLVKQVN